MVSTDIRYSPSEKMRYIRRGRPKFTLPLHFAIWNKLTAEARCLVEGGADVDAQDEYGRTPLMMCCMENDEEWSTGIATMLLQAGANVSLYDANGRNALMFSLIFKRRRMTELLLKSKDYDLYKKDKSRRTVLDYAIMTGELPTFDKSIRKSSFENSGKKPVSSRTPKPSAVCRTIIRDTLSSAKVYAPSSEMNTHQFRRLVNEEIAAKNVEKDTKGERRSSRTAKSARLQRNQHRATSARSPRRPSTALPAHVRNVRSVNEKNEMGMTRPKSASWKSIVPLLWNTLSIQYCPSYCPPATPVTQTFEEALGLPPIEDNDESTIISEDGYFQDDTEHAIPRRSSMPMSQSSHPSYKLRRRSEAIGMSTNSVTKFFFSEKKVVDGFDQPSDIDQKTQDQNNSTKTLQGRRLKQPEYAGDTIDSAPNENIASNKPRSNSISTIRGKSEYANDESSRRSSLPRSNLNKEKSGNSVTESRRGPAAVSPTRTKTKSIPDKPGSPESDDDKQYQPNNEPSSPIRTQQLISKKRRRDSVLRETVVLPNIMEEQ